MTKNKALNSFLFGWMCFFFHPQLSANNSSYFEYNPCQPFSDWCFYIDLEAGYQNFYLLPSFSFGQQVNPLIPIFAFTATDEHAESPYVKVGLGTTFASDCLPCWIGQCLDIRLSGHYFEDNKKNSATIGPVGLLLFPIVSVDAGIGLNPNLISGSFHRDYKYFGGDLEFYGCHSWSFCQNPCLNPVIVRPYVALGIHEFNQDYSILFQGITTTNAYRSLNLSEQLHSTYYDIGAGLELDYCFFSCLSAFIKGSFSGSYTHTRFYGQETFFSTFRIPSDLTLKHDTFNSKVKAATGIDYHLGRWTVGVVGNYEYWGYMPKVQNVLFDQVGDPTVSPTRIASAFGGFYSVGGKIDYTF